MSRLMTIRKGDSPVQIAALVCRECLFEDCDGVEDQAFILGLRIGTEAYRYNPCDPGTDRHEAFEVGVAISQIPPSLPPSASEPVRNECPDPQMQLPMFMSNIGIDRELSSIQSDIAASREEDAQLMLGATVAT